MQHTYRDPDVLDRGFFHPATLAFPLIVLTMTIRVGSVPFFLLVFGTLIVCLYLVYRATHYGSCGEIRLRDDGTCELETKRRTIHLHVSQIRSVKFSPEGEQSSESYTIHYDGGKLNVGSRMTEFRDFLTRLKALNPAVDLTSFPADAWPELGGTPTKKGAVGHLRSAIFPMVVIVLLLGLAFDTLVSK